MQLITEAVCYEQYGNYIDNVFKKINLYNKRQDKWLAENKYNEILFTIEEQYAIKGTFRLIQAKILENYYGKSLNEGVLDTVKNGVNAATDRVKQVATNITDKIAKLPANLKKAYDFCEQIIKAGVTKVSQLIKLFIQLLSKLGDTVRDAIISLGGFGKNNISTEELQKADKLTEGADNNDNFRQFEGDEKDFLSMVVEYAQGHATNKEMLEPINEGVFGKIADKIAQNKAAQIIICGTYNGKKISWWKSLLISIVGSIAINVGVGLIGAAFGMAAPTVAALTSIILIIWQVRGIIKIMLNRREQMKKTGDKNFFNLSTVLQLVLSISVIVIFQLPCVKEWMSDIISKAFNKGAEWAQDLWNKLVEMFGGKADTTVGAIEKTVEAATAESVSVGTDATHISQDASETISQAMRQFRNVGGFAQKVADAVQGKLPAGMNSYLFNANSHLGNGGISAIVKAAKEKGVDCVVDYVTAPAPNGEKIIAVVSFATDTPQNVIDSLGQTCLDGAKEIGADLAAFVPLASEAIAPTPIMPIDPDPEVAAEGIKLMFNGFAFVPRYADDLADKIKISMKSEPSENEYMYVTKIKDMTWADAEKAIENAGVDGNAIGLKALEQTAKDDDTYVAKIYQIVDTSDGKVNEADGDDDKANKDKAPKVDEAKLTKVLNKADQKMLVFFTSFKKDGKVVDIPLVGLNYRTMYAVDLVQSKKLGSRKNPYFFKGLFNHLTIKPVDDKDADTKRQIKEFMTKLLVTSAEALAKLCHATIVGDKKTFLSKKVWKPSEKTNNDNNRLELGNFTNNEICDILNNKDDAYKYFSGKYAEDAKGTDDFGNVTSAKRREGANAIIEDKQSYVEKKILPVISCKETQIWKELSEDKLISKFFMKDGEWKQPNGKNILLSTIVLPSGEKLNIAEMIMRSPETFARDTNVTIKDHITNLFHKKSDDSEEFSDKDAKRFSEALQRLASIIWKFKGDASAWKTQLDAYKKATDKTIENPDIDNKEQKEIVKKDSQKSDNGKSGDSQSSKDEVKPGSKFIKMFTTSLKRNGKFAAAVKQNEILKDAFYTDDELDMEKINERMNVNVRNAFKKLNRLSLKQRKIILNKKDSKVWPKIKEMYQLNDNDMSLLKNFFRVITKQRIAQHNKKISQLESTMPIGEAFLSMLARAANSLND